MTDKEAAVALMTEQGRPVESWQKAEHAYQCCSAYGAGGGMTVKAYADSVGRDVSTITQLVSAQKVRQKCLAHAKHFDEDYFSTYAARQIASLPEEDWAWFAELASSIEQVGLLQPIVIGVNNQLIAGAHRLEACKLLGWSEIDCKFVELDSLSSELAEIDENLRRNELTVLEQSQHLKRREDLLEQLGLRAKPSPGTNQYTTVEVGATVAPSKTTQDIATEVGLSKRSTQERKQIATKIVPAVQEAIAKTDVADSTRQLIDLG